MEKHSENIKKHESEMMHKKSRIEFKDISIISILKQLFHKKE